MDNIVGNVYDKYNSNNPVARLLMRGFLNSITELYNFIATRQCAGGRLR